MEINFVKNLAIFLLIFLVSCAQNFDEKPSEIWIDNGKNLIKINVEIADDDDERAKGLMFREKLNENGGMLFVFEDEDHQTFWMKNTMIPLDMIFIGTDFIIVDVKNAKPCGEDPCKLYKSSKPAMHVLEVNSGFAAKNNIKIGDKIIVNEKLLKE